MAKKKTKARATEEPTKIDRSKLTLQEKVNLFHYGSTTQPRKAKLDANNEQSKSKDESKEKKEDGEDRPSES